MPLIFTIIVTLVKLQHTFSKFQILKTFSMVTRSYVCLLSSSSPFIPEKKSFHSSVVVTETIKHLFQFLFPSIQLNTWDKFLVLFYFLSDFNFCDFFRSPSLNSEIFNNHCANFLLIKTWDTKIATNNNNV